MLKIIMESLIFVIITLLIVSAFNKYDEEINLAFTKRDVIFISITSLFCSLLINIKHNNLSEVHILVCILTVLMIIMSYTDLKTMQVYTVLDLLAIVSSAIYLVCNIEQTKNFITIYPNNIILLVNILIIVVLFITQGIGLGDSMLYFSLLLYYITNSQFGCMLFVINILISNLIFLIVNSTKFLKDKKRKLPLVPYILLAWLLTM